MNVMVIRDGADGVERVIVTSAAKVVEVRTKEIGCFYVRES